MNQDIEYEKLTQEIYQELLEQDGLTVEVKHNVKLKGRGASHQIDVYWEYTFAGVNHKVAIECKNYNKTISIGKVRDFHSALLDIGNINGIIVTKVGYQKGAIDYANEYGINLKVLREPQDNDWEGRIKTIKTEIQMISMEPTKWYIELDKEWGTKVFTIEQMKELKLNITAEDGDELCIVDDKGNILKTFSEIVNELPYNEKQHLGLEYRYPFENGFIQTDEYGSLKIKHVDITYNISVGKSQFTFDSSSITKAIIKDVKTNDIKFIKKKVY